MKIKRNEQAAKEKECISTFNFNPGKHNVAVWKQQTTFLKPSFGYFQNT